MGLVHIRKEVGLGIQQWAEIGAKMEKSRILDLNSLLWQLHDPSSSGNTYKVE